MDPPAPRIRVVVIPRVHTQFRKLGQLVRVILPLEHTRVYAVRHLPTIDWYKKG